MSKPILYSFRRCPYAIRARLALQITGFKTELREILLRDKAPEFLAVSPPQTVPALVLGNEVIDESLDIMKWALQQNDPGHWLDMPRAGHALIAEADGPFKAALDRTKYASRYPGEDKLDHRARAAKFLYQLDQRLQPGYLFGPNPSLADMAILPFVRQFAFIDKDWFDAQDWPDLKRWLKAFLASGLFLAVMGKYPKWQAGEAATIFPASANI